MKIDESFILELWEKEMKRKKNIFDNVDEYKEKLKKAEECEKSLKSVLQPCDYDLLENYKDILRELCDIAEYASYRAGCISMMGILNLAFDDWYGKAVIKQVDGEPYIFLENEE
ncbi:MAG: hypothetical protein K2H13_09315 [Eubacterium sp.]|nr:hypothetical protein [Eubacterium sp.]